MRHASLAIAVLLVPLVAVAKPKPKPAKGKKAAKVHVDAAAKFHKDGNFPEALTELQAAYKLDPQPKLLFAIAQVQAKLDNCPDAIDSYEKFLKKTKDKRKRTVVKQAIDACKVKIADAKMSEDKLVEPAPAGTDVFREEKPAEPVVIETPPAPIETPPAPIETLPPPISPPAVTAVTTPAPAPALSQRKPWYKDIVGDALVAGGIASGVAAVIMYSGARGSLDDAEGAASIDAYQDLVDQAHDKRTYAVVFGAGGVALLGAGILRFALRDSGEGRAVAVAPTLGGGLITWSGGF